MKSIKKIIALLLVLALVFAMTACGDSDDEGGKKGESRKSSQEKEADPTDEPTPTAEPTDEPTPTAEPTVEPTAEPTPTPTTVPAPVGDITYSDIAGLWKCDIEVTSEMFGQMGAGQEYDQFLEIFKSFGYDVNVKMHMDINFKSADTATVTYEADATSMGVALKKILSTEDGVLTFYAMALGMDKESVRSLLAMSGSTIEDLVAQIDIDSMMDQMKQGDEKTVSYTIKGNTIMLDNDDDVVLEYVSSNCIKFKVQDSSDEVTALFQGATLTR